MNRILTTPPNIYTWRYKYEKPELAGVWTVTAYNEQDARAKVTEAVSKVHGPNPIVDLIRCVKTF